MVCTCTLAGYGYDRCGYGVVQPNPYYTRAEPYLCEPCESLLLHNYIASNEQSKWALPGIEQPQNNQQQEFVALSYFRLASVYLIALATSTKAFGHVSSSPGLPAKPLASLRSSVLHCQMIHCGQVGPLPMQIPSPLADKANNGREMEDSENFLKVWETALEALEVFDDTGQQGEYL